MGRALKILGLCFLSGVCLLLLAYVGLIVYFHVAAPKSPVVDDSDLRFVEPEIPDSENAYVAFLAATNLFACSVKDSRTCIAYRRYQDGRIDEFNSCWEGGDIETCRAAVDKILDEHEAAFSAFNMLLELPGWRAVPDAEGMFFPPRAMAGETSLLLHLKSVRAREKGEFETALSIDRDCLALWGRCRDNASSIAELLVGCAYFELAHKRMLALANLDGVPDDILVSIEAAMRDEFDAREIFERAVKREYMNIGDWMLGKMDDAVATCNDAMTLLNFLTDGGAVPSLMGVLLRIPGTGRFAYDHGMTQQLLADAFRAGLAGRNSDEIIVAGAQGGFSRPNWAGRLVVIGIVPAIAPASSHLHCALFKMRALRIAVAVQRYRRANGGDYPPDLSELVPAYLEEVPRDPFAPEDAIHYDAATRLAWCVGKDGDFDPFADNPKMLQYSIRLDGERLAF